MKQFKIKYKNALMQLTQTKLERLVNLLRVYVVPSSFRSTLRYKDEPLVKNERKITK
jgi:hypothetical protein